MSEQLITPNADNSTANDATVAPSSDQGILAKNQCSSITLSGHRCNNLCVIGIEYCWLHLAIFFHLELKQSTQRDNQGHQLKSLGLFCCGGLEGYTVNNPVFRPNEEVLPMKAQRKSRQQGSRG